MKWSKVSDVLQFLFAVFFTLSITGYFAPLGIDPHHDGILMKPAIDLLHGKMLFRDSFSQYGALTTILQAGAMHFFGEYLIVIRYLTVLFYGAIAGVMWLFWRRYIPSFLATLSVILWVGLFGFYDQVGLLPWSAVYALLCQMIALYLLVEWTQQKKLWMMAGIGICASLAFWFRQPIGIYILAAVVLFWGVAKIKNVKIGSLIPMFAAFFVVNLFFLAWLFQNHALSQWWEQSISFASSWEKAVATQYRFPFFQISMLLPLSESGISIWIVLPFTMLYFAYKLIIIKKLSSKEIQLLATVSMCIFSWVQYYPMGDPGHCSWATTPMIGLFLYVTWNNNFKNKKRIALFLILLILFVPDVFNRSRDAKRKIKINYITFKDENILKGMKEPKMNYQYFTTLIRAIEVYEKSHPNTFVLSLSPDALYPLFGKNNVNCSRFTVDWKWDTFDKKITKQYRAETDACLKKFQPLVYTDAMHVNPKNYSHLTATPATSCENISHIGYLLAPIFPQ